MDVYHLLWVLWETASSSTIVTCKSPYTYELWVWVMLICLYSKSKYKYA